jgi:hypothetical protein
MPDLDQIKQGEQGCGTGAGVARDGAVKAILSEEEIWLLIRCT